MALNSIVIGSLLVALGLIGYSAPDTLGKLGEKGVSPTALIPAAFGVLIALCGVIVLIKESLRKHAMHAAAMFGLLGAIGGVMPLVRGGMNVELASVKSGLIMIILCVGFVILCVRSFILARIARKSGLSA